MDRDQWQVDVLRRVVAHPSGLVLRFQGKPGTDYFGCNPLVIPENLSPLELARLIRLGVEYFTQAATEKENSID